VSTWATVFLGIIAMATLVTAVLQVVLLVAGWQLVRRVTKFIEDIDRDLRPIIANVSSIASDASRIASLAAAQVERADQILSSAVVKLEDLLTNVSSIVIKTMREGNALVMGVRAVMAAIQALRRRRRGRSEDDEALFI
jgi:hypothetical protein